MSMNTGIVGLPNVGKSTLFNTLTNSNVLAANYRFATLEPNVGIVNLPDTRLKKLKDIYNSNKIIPATFKFVDIAGLIEGASKGEGLGNQFLQNIREVDSICHVVRCFENKEVTHEYNTIDPIRDMQIINLELIISDLDIVSKRIDRIKKKAKSGDKELSKELSVLEVVHKQLEDYKSARELNLDEDSLMIIKSLNLITLKPCLYIANISEEDIRDPLKNKHYKALSEKLSESNEKLIAISIKIENEINSLDEETKNEFMLDLGLEYTGLESMIKTSFDMLGLSTFFTCGVQEIHSWIFKKGMTAPECAGIIHTDFQRGFIKADVVSYDDLIESSNETIAREKGKIRLEGKTYKLQDGDICNFKFNV